MKDKKCDKVLEFVFGIIFLKKVVKYLNMFKWYYSSYYFVMTGLINGVLKRT